MTNDRTRLDPATEDALWDAVDRLGDTPLPGEAGDANIVAGALAGLDEGIPPLEEERPRDADPRPRWAAAVAVAFVAGAIAAAILLLIVRSDVGGWFSPQETDTPPLAPSVSEHAAVEGDAVQKAGPASKRTPIPAPQPDEEPDVEAPVATDDGATGGARSDRPRRRKPKPDSAALLRRARHHLEAGDTKLALQDYRELQRRFAGSREAKAALVSMGRIELRRGRAKAALRHFDDYLASSAGTLREEARYGRIRALRALHRRAQEGASIDAFLADHPKSIYAPRLRERAQRLEASP